MFFEKMGLGIILDSIDNIIKIIFENLSICLDSGYFVADFNNESYTITVLARAG